jgi:hypothetical protein
MPTRLPMLLIVLAVASSVRAESRVLDGELHHLRCEGPPEWTEFPASPESDRLECSFDAVQNPAEQTLRLRQQDVKQVWRVKLNDRELGQLRRDENDMVVYFAVPADGIVSGKNVLRIEQDARGKVVPDDVRVGEVILDPRPVQEVLTEATLVVTVADEGTGQAIPSRLTVLDEHGALQSVWAAPSPQLAVRPGTVYSATGEARLGLPVGKFTLLAGRGFEYSLASVEVTLTAGETAHQRLTIRREVPTEGYVACDTHVHTLTHSGHGDATAEERMATIAGEGIELPVATDHNVQIDHDPVARAVGVRQYFTPVIGNEVTTPVGHFNIFPVPRDAPVPNHRQTEWGAIFDEIEARTGAPIVVLNHARDLHSGVRPFGPERFNAATAESVLGWPYRFTAMEVVNSSATQSDWRRLFLDWMSLLNRGVAVTPIGSSDSHDVARHFVGQGRTYLRCDDHDPGHIEVDRAVESLRRGSVRVSYGLLVELKVGDSSSGDVATVEGGTIPVDVRVLGPHWTSAERVELFVNGRPEFEQSIRPEDATTPGVKWTGRWVLPRPAHDVHLVAIASGPGIAGSWWKTAKPYQARSPDWEPRVFGCSGALWVDADGDGAATPARTYAERAWNESQGDLPRLVALLEKYDAAVAAQAAGLYQAAGGEFTDPKFTAAMQSAVPSVKAGFQQFQESWRETQAARAGIVE